MNYSKSGGLGDRVARHPISPTTLFTDFFLLREVSDHQRGLEQSAAFTSWCLEATSRNLSLRTTSLPEGLLFQASPPDRELEQVTEELYRGIDFSALYIDEAADLKEQHIRQCSTDLEAQEEQEGFENKLLALRGQSALVGGASEHALDMIADMLEEIWRMT